jgi:hypothetical protein
MGKRQKKLYKKKFKRKIIKRWKNVLFLLPMQRLTEKLTDKILKLQQENRKCERHHMLVSAASFGSNLEHF